MLYYAAIVLLGRLDVLIYADMNSEPMSHFLGYARLARVQAVFWGNPITTGEATITASPHPLRTLCKRA